MQTSIIKYSELKQASHSYRWDAEFFDPRVLYNETLIDQYNFVYFDTLIDELTGGATPLGAEYLDQGIPFLRVQNIMYNYIDLSDVVYINKKDHQTLYRSQLKKNDVLLTITGVSYGKSAVVTDEFIGYNINQHSVRIKVKSINPFFLSTFLNCKYGYTQSTKHIVGITRAALDYTSIRKFKIPIFSEKFQKSIEDMVLSAHTEREKANTLTKEAQILLEKELGIYNWTPPKPKDNLNISIKKYSETQQSNRIDAEYYQPKYDAILEKITSYKGGYKTLGESFSVTGGSFISDYYYVNKSNRAYLRIKELSLTNTINQDQIVYISNEYQRKAETIVEKDDFVIATIGATIGKINCIPQELHGSFISNNTSRLTVKDKQEILPLCYETVLQHSIIQSQVNKLMGQTAQPKILDSDLRSIIIPLIDKKLQEQIAEKITTAHRSRKESKRLLELAKSTVEHAIEHGELHT